MSYTDKVLIVDDVPLMRSMLRSILTGNGYESVGQAASGDEALVMLEKGDYSLVMLDIDMPGASGMQILKSIRDLGRPVFVVMVSSHSTMENVKSAIEMGANGFVVKPYKETKIGDILSKYRAWADESAAAAADII